MPTEPFARRVADSATERTNTRGVDGGVEVEGAVVEHVVAVDLHRVRIPLVAPFRTAHGVQHDRDVVLVAARDGDGRTGWGECVAMNRPTYSPEYADGAAHVLEHHLVPLVLDGGDASAIAGHPMAKAALEAALLDLALQRAGRRLADELGGHGGPVAVGAVVGIAPSIDDLLTEVGQRVTEGYTRIKVKIRPGWDREPLAAVRAEYPALALWADANGDYGEDDLAGLCSLDDLGLGLVEQPFAADELMLHAALAEALATPVCLDESVTSVGSLRIAIDLGACDTLNVKPGRVGGLRTALQLVRSVASTASTRGAAACSRPASDGRRTSRSPPCRGSRCQATCRRRRGTSSAT